MVRARLTPFAAPATRRIALLLALAATAALGAGSTTASAASIRPSVRTQLGDPALGNTLTGQVAWTATTKGTNVTKVAFLVDGTQLWVDTTAPYQFGGDPNGTLDTTALSDGSHNFTVKAYGGEGRSASAHVKAQVSNSGPIQTAFTVGSSIADGSTLTGDVAWTATPSGASVSRVEFLVDGAASWTEAFSPYRFNGDTGSLDTSTLSPGSHVLAVVATATDGRTASTSSTVTVAGRASTGFSPAPSAVPADVPAYGVSLGGKSLFRSAADRIFELDQIRAAANGHRAVVRIDSTPGNQAWVDQWVTDALARNLEPLLILFGTTAPVSVDAATTFASAQGAKWRGRIRLFELANEPDLNGWTPEGYTADLKAADVALKSANPDAIMIAGALWKWDSGSTANPSGGARAWVSRMYQAGAKGYFDMLSLHFYDDPDDHGSWNLWDQAFTTGPSIRSIMDANGDQSIPIASTESGGPVNKYGETGQATILDHGFNHLYAGQIRMLLVYTMLNDDVPGFGLLRDDRSKRPAWFAFQNRAV